MGISLNSIHIFGDALPKNCDYSFQSFSSNWLTCVEDFSEKMPDYSYKAAKRISKATDNPVLYFEVFDSEMIWFEFFCKGKIVARYSDDELVANKKLYDIPYLVGYQDGNKKRLSNLLACSDVELKISMLEEFLGVCLLFEPELSDEEGMLCRNRDDSIYREYQSKEKALTGKAAPIAIKQIAEYPGKIFFDKFGYCETIKPHFFLYGYASEDTMVRHNYRTLTPVRFTGHSLETVDPDTFNQGRVPSTDRDSRFKMDYSTPSRVTFLDGCPPDYCGKTMVLPNGFYPWEFLPTGELLLWGKNKIYVTDSTFKIIAKLSIKGDVADLVDNYILTTTGDSFCGYCYEPKAKIYIYEVVKKQISESK